MSFSPDGSRIVTGSEDGTAKVWDASTRAALLDLTGASGRSVDSSRTARTGTGSSPQAGRRGTWEVKVWDARTGVLLTELRGPGEPIRSAALSPDGKLIVTVNTALHLQPAGERLGWGKREAGCSKSREPGMSLNHVWLSQDGENRRGRSGRHPRLGRTYRARIAGRGNSAGATTGGDQPGRSFHRAPRRQSCGTDPAGSRQGRAQVS